MVSHIVLFRFSDPNDAVESRQRLLSLVGKIPGMQTLEAGLDFTKSERSAHLGLITRHDSRAALDAYQVHPLHVEVATFIRARVAGSTAVDFEH